jgi:hypothetical protein
VKQLALCFLLLLVGATSALAANWTQLPGTYGADNDLAYVDIASVRQDTYPKSSYAASNKSYVVAWLATADQNGRWTSHLEVVFDCKGRSGIVQQVIDNDSPDSKYYSFNLTPYFESVGARTSSIIPESFYERAESMICKSKH